MNQEYELTEHAKRRMLSREINLDAVEAALSYGRKVYVRGAVIFAIGKTEARAWIRRGIDLWKHRGVQVVCSVDRRVAVVTVYRSRDLRRLSPQE
jgi:hypothetical protein